MKGTIILGFAIALVYLVLQLTPEARERAQQSNYYQERIAAIQIERAQDQLDQERERSKLNAVLSEDRAIQLHQPSIWVAILIMTFAGLGIGGGITLVLMRGFRTTLYVWPNDKGMLPIPMQRLEEGSLLGLQGYHRAMFASASKPNVPHNFSPHSTYAPHIIRSIRALETGEGSLEINANNEDDLPTPTFGELLAHNEIGPGQLLLLGSDARTGEPIRGELRDLYSSAIAGLAATGKSTTTRFLILQTIIQGCKLCLIDYHGSDTVDPELMKRSLAQTLKPVSSCFIREVATDPEQAIKTVQFVQSVLDQRKKQGVRGYPLLLVIDEFSTVMRDERVSKAISKLLEDLNTQGNKYWVFILYVGHQWQSTRTGGTEVRDTLNTAYVHRIARRQAAMLTHYRAGDLPETMDLREGQAWLFRANADPILVNIPNTTREDVANVAMLIPKQQSLHTPTPTDHQEEREEALQQVISNGAESFAECCLIDKEDSYIGATDLYNEYVNWCSDNNLTPINQTRFGNELRALGYDKDSSSGKVRYIGIALRRDQDG